jgi:hypothetical protein
MSSSWLLSPVVSVSRVSRQPVALPVPTTQHHSIIGQVVIQLLPNCRMGNSQPLNSNTNGKLEHHSGFYRSYQKVGSQTGCAIGVDGHSSHTRLLDTTYSLRSPKAALRRKSICPYGYVYETTDLDGCVIVLGKSIIVPSLIQMAFSISGGR